MKLLVVYYSLDGNTREIAEYIAKEKSADLMELKPVKGLPKKMFPKMMKGGFLATIGAGCKLHSTGVSPLIYENIVLGFPVWAGKPCPAANEFINKFNVADKVTSVFTFSGSGDNEKCIEIIKKKLPNLENTVSLVDRNVPEKAVHNAEKLKEFMDRI